MSAPKLGTEWQRERLVANLQVARDEAAAYFGADQGLHQAIDTALRLAETTAVEEMEAHSQDTRDS